MTDRELLELAAKAAGMELRYNKLGELIDEYWNPLRYDGDAMRLAVKLMIEIDHSPWQQTVDLYYRPYYSQRTFELSEPYNNDPYAATRRAITRAAAEIGRSMK